MRWAKRTGGEICYSIILDHDKYMVKKCIYCIYLYIWYMYVYYNYYILCNRKYTNNILLIYLSSVNETTDINCLELQNSVRAVMLSCAGVSKQGQGHWVQLVAGIVLGGEDIHGYRKNPGKQHGTWKSPVWKGKTSSKPLLLGSMLNFGGVSIELKGQGQNTQDGDDMDWCLCMLNSTKYLVRIS